MMKKILALLLALLMMLGVLASCGGNSNDNDDDVQNEANDNGDDVQNEANDNGDDVQNEANDNGDDVQNEVNDNGEGVEDENSNNGNNQNESNLTKELISYVLNNSEYNKNIQKAIADYEYSNSTAFDPHPYAYLAEKGHDVEAIKNGTIECETITYVLEEKPDILYMGVKVYENKIATHYHFGLKLTKSQMEDYQKINGEPYVQAPFTNDAITVLNKNIVEETCVRITEEASKYLNEDFADNYEHLWEDVFMILKDVDAENRAFTFLTIPRYKNNDKVAKHNTARIGQTYSKSDLPITYSDNVYYLPTMLRYINNLEYNTQHGAVWDLQDFNWTNCSLGLT